MGAARPHRYEYPRPLATVDVVPICLANGRLMVGTLVREEESARGRRALPGGFVRPGEDADVESAALRVLKDKAGVAPQHLEQLAVFSGAERDPREWSLSVSFLAVLPPLPDGPDADDAVRDDKPASEAPRAALDLTPLDETPPLAFDHDHIVREAIARLRSKAGYSSLPLHLLAEPFTLPQAHAAYELALEGPLDRAAFRRKILDAGFLIETDRMTRAHGRAARPARLYRRAESLLFTPRNFAAGR